MKHYTLFICTVAVAMMVSVSAQAISIIQSSDPTALANALIGPGITLVGTPTLTGAPVQSGTFTGGAADLGINSGVVLSSGDVTQIPGANSTSNPEAIGGGINGLGYGDNITSTDIGSAYPGNGAGHPALTTLSGYDTTDASILTFQFQFGNGSIGGNVGIRYVFASEEYIDYANTVFNDVFGFFVDGTNIALTPGSGNPVAVDTINPTVNSSCYINNVDNTDGLPVANRQITLDGLTCVLTGQALGLGAGVHTMMFAIADASDHILDSAVFLGGGTFSTETEPERVPEPSSMLLLGFGLAGLSLLRRQKKTS